VLHDLVRGEVRFPEGMVGDFVLLRSNGLPTYNFAATVDDAAMRITHVIRAEEHLANTPRQLMLYEALREKPPDFAHVPLILNSDRSKMSKRQGEVAVAVSDWRRAGYVPDALLAYLAFLGFHPGDDREILTREELLEAFAMERIGKSGSVFDAQKLSWVNAHFLHHADGARILGWVERARDEEPPEWIQAFDRLAHGVKPEILKTVVELVRGNIRTLEELPAELAVLLDSPRLEDAARPVLEDPKARQVCRAVADELRGLAAWTGSEIKSAILRAGARLGVQGKVLFQPVRVALTGRTHGPELALLAEFLDKEPGLSYLDGAAQERTS
jgi:glutamyl-tRNA synthetase